MFIVLNMTYLFSPLYSALTKGNICLSKSFCFESMHLHLCKSERGEAHNSSHSWWLKYPCGTSLLHSCFMDISLFEVNFYRFSHRKFPSVSFPPVVAAEHYHQHSSLQSDTLKKKTWQKMLSWHDGKNFHISSFLDSFLLIFIKSTFLCFKNRTNIGISTTDCNK